MSDQIPTIGFIGAGRMASALACGCVQSQLVPNTQIIASDPNEVALQHWTQQLPGARVVSDNAQVLANAELILLAVKPQVLPQVLADLAPHVTRDHLLVSIAAGFPLRKLAAALPEGTRLIRVMPNTPCLVGLGASAFSCGSYATDDDSRAVQQILESVGIAHKIDEQHLDAITGLSGSGPAFVYRIIEALAAGGVASGLPEKLALEFASQTVRGAAEMVRTTGKSPEQLCQQVTSPGGTTLAGLDAYEKAGDGKSLLAAVEAATRRSIELGQQ